MIELFPFFIILFVGVFFSEIFSRLHLPWVIALIVGGIIVGPSGLGVFEPNTTIEFLGQVGLVFLMFMAGLETKFSSFREIEKTAFPLVFLNAGIPFLVGVAITFSFGYGLSTALLIGVIFMSSSIAVVIPALQSAGFLGSRVGHTIVTTTIIEDVASLVLFSILLQKADPVTSLPLPAFYALAVLVLLILRFLVPKIRFFFTYTDEEKAKDVFQQELRSIFVIMIGTVVMFEVLGFHPIIAGFFAGFILSDSVKSRLLKDRLQAISYGVFIPVFFVLVGTRTDIGVLFSLTSIALLAFVLSFGSITSKFFSGWLGARLEGFSKQESFLVGVSTIPQLSTTLAVAFSGVELGLIDQELASAIVVLSIVTTLISPLLIKWVSGKVVVTPEGHVIESKL